MEIFDGSTTPVNYSYAFSSIPAARNKYAGLGRSTASAVLLVNIRDISILVLWPTLRLSQDWSNHKPREFESVHHRLYALKHNPQHTPLMPDADART